VPYKRIDLAIRAAIACGRHLVVVGRGSESARLRTLAAEASGSGRVTFAATVSTAQLPAYYAHARCFVFPGLEDFGITPLESTACGRPVVAYRAGGALDTVVEGLNGVFFEEQSIAALSEALADPRLDGSWDEKAMATHAERFSRADFRTRIARRLSAAIAHHREGRDHV
jgi:glycosyltransferase involved in cell wall biosynthesis